MVQVDLVEWGGQAATFREPISWDLPLVEMVPTKVGPEVPEVDQIGVDLGVQREPQGSTEAWVT